MTIQKETPETPYKTAIVGGALQPTGAKVHHDSTKQQHYGFTCQQPPLNLMNPCNNW
jgi:hypothetical protein